LTLPSTQPRCWAVYMERVLARMSSYVLAVPSVVYRPSSLHRPKCNVHR